jgi:hypothetical protein
MYRSCSETTASEGPGLKKAGDDPIINGVQLKYHHMLPLNFFLSIIAITLAVSAIQWLFTGFLFHKYQRATPLTWKKESIRSYGASMVLNFLFSVFFTTLIYLWKTRYGTVSTGQGIGFSFICWLTFSLTAELGSAIYVNYSPLFVLGKCLSSLFEYMVASVLAILIL